MVESGDPSSELLELLELLEELESGLLELEGAVARGEDARPLVHALFRIAHNLKSSLAFQGLAGTSTLFHAVETALDRLREGRLDSDETLIDLLMEAVDAGRAAVADPSGADADHEALRVSLLNAGQESGGARERKAAGIGDTAQRALAEAIGPGLSAWLLEKAIGADMDEGTAFGLPIFDTVAEIGRVAFREVKRSNSGEAILAIVFVTSLDAEELSYSIFDPIMPLDTSGLETAGDSTAGSRPGPGLRMLAVDDERLSLDLMALILGKEGQVDRASSAAECLKLFREAAGSRPYDAIFLDVMLGDGSGLDVLAAIRREELAAGVQPGHGSKVAICTSIKDYATVSEAFRGQCDYYLVKPLSEQKLRDALARMDVANAAERKPTAQADRSVGDAVAKAPQATPESTGAATATAAKLGCAASPASHGPATGRVADRAAPRGQAPSAAAAATPDVDRDPFGELAELDRVFAATPTLEGLCRTAVERGRRFLDLDRLCIFLFDAATGTMRATSGVDAEGRVVDEGDFSSPVPEDGFFQREWGERRQILAVVEDRELRFKGDIVGRGWSANFPLRNGPEIFGWIVADNLLTHRSLQPMQRWLFALFGELLASHFVRKRSRDELVKAVADLSRDNSRREAELRRFKAEARGQTALKERLFTIFAHDLRGPIGAVRGILDLAVDADSPLSDDEIRAYLPELQDSISTAWRLLENLLDWVRSQLDEIGEIRERVSLAESVRQAVRDLEASAGRKGVGMMVDIAAGHCVLGDARIVEAILRNLISNAVKFSPPGSTILIHAARDSERRESVVAVTDRGVGMDDDQLRRLFTMDPGKKREGTAGERGSGIGLVFCADLARRLGARIEVESEVGSGSSFSLVIPEREEGELAPL